MIKLLNLFRKNNKSEDKTSSKTNKTELVIEEVVENRDPVKELIAHANKELGPITYMLDIFKFCISEQYARGLRVDSMRTSFCIQQKVSMQEPKLCEVVDQIRINHHTLPYFGLTNKVMVFNDIPVNYKDLYTSVMLFMGSDIGSYEVIADTVDTTIKNAIERHLTIGGLPTSEVSVAMSLDCTIDHKLKSKGVVLTYDVRFDEKLSVHAACVIR